MSVLDLQNEIDQLRKKLGDFEDEPLTLQNPSESDDDVKEDKKEEVNDVKEDKKEEVNDVKDDKKEEVNDVNDDKDDDVKDDKKEEVNDVNDVKDDDVKDDKKEEVNDVNDVKDDDVKDDKKDEVNDVKERTEVPHYIPLTKEDKKLVKETYTKARENLKVFEEIMNRIIQENKDLDLNDEELDEIENAYEIEFNTFKDNFKKIINKLPKGLDLKEDQYEMLEKRIDLVEKRY